MPGNVNLVRKDGTVVSVKPEDVQDLLSLGYREQGAQEYTQGLQQKAESDYYSSGKQQALAGVEGFASGLTMGGSDLIQQAIDPEDDAAAKRGAYNSGTRGAAEIAGLILPTIATFGEAAGEQGIVKGMTRGAAELLPSSALSRGATALGERVAGRGLAGKVVAGAVEGGVAGAGSAEVQATLSGDPATTEHILAAAGMGVVFGAGGGAVGYGLEKLGTKAMGRLAKPVANETDDLDAELLKQFGGRAADYSDQLNDLTPVSVAGKTADTAEASVDWEAAIAKAKRKPDPSPYSWEGDKYVYKPQPASELEAREAAAEQFLPSDDWNGFRQGIKDARSEADRLLNSADDANVLVDKWAKLPTPQRLEQLGKVGTDVMSAALASNAKAVKKETSAVRAAWRWASKAVRDNSDTVAGSGAAKIDVQLQKYKDAVERLAEVSGQKAMWPTGVSKAVSGFQDIAKFHQSVYGLWDEAMSFGAESPGFLKAGDKSIEPFMAHFESIMSSPLAEAKPIQQSFSKQIDQLLEKAGLTVEGTPVEKLRALQKAGKAQWVQSGDSWLDRNYKMTPEDEARVAAAKSANPPVDKHAPIDVPDFSRSQLDAENEAMLKEQAQRAAKVEDPKDGSKGGWTRDLIKRGALNGALFVAGVPWFARHSLVGALLGAKAASGQAIDRAVSKLAGVGRVVGKTGPFLYPLYHGLSGTQDPEGDIQEAFARRSQELREAAVTGKDKAFQLAQELAAAGHPELGDAVYKVAPNVVSVLMEKLPRVPFGTGWGTDYKWEVPQEQLAIFSQEYMAGVQPTMFLQEAAENPGDIFPSAVEVLQKAWPSLYSDFRAKAMQELLKRGTQDMEPHELSGWATLLDAPLDPTRTNDFIAAQAAMFAEPPQQMPNQPGKSGRPAATSGPGTSASATPAQQLEAR